MEEINTQTATIAGTNNLKTIPVIISILHTATLVLLLAVSGATIKGRYWGAMVIAPMDSNSDRVANIVYSVDERFLSPVIEYNISIDVVSDRTPDAPSIPADSALYAEANFIKVLQENKTLQSGLYHGGLTWSDGEILGSMVRHALILRESGAVLAVPSYSRHRAVAVLLIIISLSLSAWHLLWFLCSSVAQPYPKS